MRWVCGVAMLLTVACGRPINAVPAAPPAGAAATTQWSYAAYLLSRGDARTAREYLEPLTLDTRVDLSDPALFWRDVAEARLFSGDDVGVQSAAERATRELAHEPNTAQFNADDRNLFQRTIDALDAAARGDAPRLAAIGANERPAPSADAWYLLGRVYEQRGDLEAARAVYRAYLDRAPQWSFLREAFEMRRHAQLMVR